MSDATDMRLFDAEAHLEKALLERPAASGAAWQIRCFAEVESTMDAARELAGELKAGQAGLVLAGRQTRGRGRHGRQWESVAEGFYATYVFAAPQQLPLLSGYSLVVGVVLHKMLHSISCDVRLKWPNDVVSPTGKKICGVLIEVVQREGQPYVLTGIGINLKGDVSHVNSQEGAVTVGELCGESFTAFDIAEMLSSRLYSAFSCFVQKGFGAYRQKWLSAARHTDEILTVESGQQVFCGRFKGVSGEGALQLEVAGKVQEVMSGHVVNVV